MADLRKLKDKAAEHLAKGRFSKAAEALGQLVAAEPKDIALRQKLGDALRKSGDRSGALAVYADVADRYARDGQLLKAVAICKLVLEIDPRHAETLERLAELYARKRGVGIRIEGLRAAPPPVPAEESEPAVEIQLEPAPEAEAEVPAPQPPPPAATPFEAILGAARERAAAEGEALLLGDAAFGDDDEPAPAPRPAAPELPRIPLFSDLPPAAFVALAGRLSLHRAPAGTAILREGEPGTSFFVLASGAVRVERAGADGRPVALARLGEGTFFGEMAILSGEPRTATVIAEEECELLEIRAEVLLDLAREHPQLVQSLARFYRRRLLANAMATSPIFRPFSRDERAALMGRFRTREAPAGSTVIAEGAPSDGLYVVLSGALGVWKRTDAGPALAARLREGDLFGEMSCLRKAPASATVRAERRSVLLRLPRPAFDELVVTHPQILELVSELVDERQHALDAVAGGRARLGDEGLLLV